LEWVENEAGANGQPKIFIPTQQLEKREGYCDLRMPKHIDITHNFITRPTPRPKEL